MESDDEENVEPLLLDGEVKLKESLIWAWNERPMLTFYDNSKTIGTFKFVGDKVIFEGDVEESAKIFFDRVVAYRDEVLKQKDDRIKHLEETVDFLNNQVWYGDD